MDRVEIVWTTQVRPQQVATSVQGHVTLFGWALQESTGIAEAVVTLYNGTDTTGLVTAVITLEPNQSVRDWFGPQGVHMNVGLWSVITSGTVVGSLFIATGWENPQ